MLLVLDASRSMNAPSGDGSGDSRLDAAKAAVDEVLDTVPADAPLGPARVRRAGRRTRGARRRAPDTELVAPVEAGDRGGACARRCRPSTGRGERRSARSLLATPGDFAGDDRAPPGDPRLRRPGQLLAAVAVHRRAARVAPRRGARRSRSSASRSTPGRGARCSCIARAGGGTYVDASDTDALRAELLAAFARSFRSYEPAGTPVEGGTDPADAPRLGEGQYREELLPGDVRDYTVSVGPGQRLLVSITSIPDRATEGSGTLRADLTGRDGPVVTDEFVDVDGDVSGQYGQIDTISLARAAGGRAGRPERRAPRRLHRPPALRGGHARPAAAADRDLGPGARPGRGAGQGERARAAARAGRHAAAVGDARGDAGAASPPATAAATSRCSGRSAAAGWSSACSRDWSSRGGGAGEARRHGRGRARGARDRRGAGGRRDARAGRGRRLVRDRAGARERPLPRHAAARRAPVLRDPRRARPAAARAGRCCSRTTRTTTPTTRSASASRRPRGRSRCSRTSSATSPATARSTTATRASRSSSSRRRPTTIGTGLDDVATYRGPGVWYVSLYLPTQDAKPRRREFPVALELEVVGEPQDDASPDPTPAPERTATPEAADGGGDGGGGPGPLAILGVGAVGVAVGLVAARARRRSSACALGARRSGRCPRWSARSQRAARAVPGPVPGPS